MYVLQLREQWHWFHYYLIGELWTDFSEIYCQLPDTKKNITIIIVESVNRV